MPSSHLKNNKAKLCRLIIDQGTVTLRLYLDSIHPPATLPGVLNSYYSLLNGLRVTNAEQMKKLYPPSGVLPSLPTTTSNDYDITLLFILLRNICGLAAPITTGSWDANPPPHDLNPEADLVRVKYYRNLLYHMEDTEVSDADFDTYWNDISSALTRLCRKPGIGVDPRGNIAYIKTAWLDEDYNIGLLNEWFESDKQVEALVLNVLDETKKVGEIASKYEVLLNENLKEAKETGEKVMLYENLGRENLNRTKIIGETLEHLKSVQVAQSKAIIIGFLFLLCLLYLYYVSPQNEPIPRGYSYLNVPLNLSNPHFVGRKWVFQKFEEILNQSSVRGVLLVCELGWGKSATMKRLIDSPMSSAVIHNNIIGYHFCRYNSKTTRRNGKQFVRDLARLISEKNKEYAEIVGNDQLIQSAISRCERQPVECFESAIVNPLQKLSDIDRNISFIVIDALDECLEIEQRHQSVILDILHRGFPKLPRWVKIIATSRNQPQSIGKMSKIGFSIWKVEVEDDRHERDLRMYANQTLHHFFTEIPQTKEKLSLDDMIDLALKSSKFNFLFLQTILEFWKKYPSEIDSQSRPEDLGKVFTEVFSKRFNEADFRLFEPFFEVLLAASSPPTFFELNKIINYRYENYNTRVIVDKLSEYLKSDHGPIEFHHQFFAEWLKNQTSNVDGIVIQKSRGHQYIADYLFHFYDERHTGVRFEEISQLCVHVLNGEKATESNLNRLALLNVSGVRDSWSRCILHDLASKRDATAIISVFVKQFDHVDILDDDDWTPAMHAVASGNHENVKLFIENGATVNHVVKRTFCFFWDFMVLRDSYEKNASMSFIAAYRGYEEIANLVIRTVVASGGNLEETDGCGWKPLYAAAVMGHYKIVELYINNEAQADLISLHHAAARNHTKIARFLLNTGVRDTCLPCKSGKISWCRHNLRRFHHCLCETALHAAVSRDNVEMASIILTYGNASVNCVHGSGWTPLMEAMWRKNSRMVDLLVSAGADVDAECQSSNSNLFNECSFKAYEEDEWLYNRHCNQPVCSHGGRMADFLSALGAWSMNLPYLSKSKGKVSDNVSTIIAVGIHDKIDYINAMYGSEINTIPHMKTLLRYIAVCHSVEILKHILSTGNYTIFTSFHEDGKTLLHFATLGSSKRRTEPYVTQSCASTLCVCPNRTRKDIVGEKRLETVELLAGVLTSVINKRDNHGRTPLHYAAVHVSTDVTKALVNAGADWRTEDDVGDTALEYALREREPSDIPKNQPLDELAMFLLQNMTVMKCDSRTKWLLSALLAHRMPRCLNKLFESGLSVNCAREEFTRYLNASISVDWSRRYDEVLEVYKNFLIDVKVVCDASFSESEVHLMAYLGTPSLQVGNLFQKSINGNSFPLQRFIENDSKGVDILNQCYDREGFLPFHRAVQGTNLDAVLWFIEIGVDVCRKTKSGLTALSLATFNYPDSSSFVPLENHRKRIFEIFLRKIEEEEPAKFRCNADLIDLSPLHVAGSRGMGILNTFRLRMPEFPLICTNSDGIQPIYLAYLFHATNPYLSLKDKQAFHDLGLSPERPPSKCPDREAEYHLIYNQFYRTPKVDMRSSLSDEGLFKCPGINELLPYRNVIEDSMQLKGCVTRCWQLAFEARCDFSLIFPYLRTQNNISNPFTDRFVDILALMAELRFHLLKMFHFRCYQFSSIAILEKKLWRNVAKAHACTRTCSCFEIMLLLQQALTAEPTMYKIVGKFVAERMGWHDTSPNGDVLYRWPFRFLLKKGKRMETDYKYLEILSPRF
ncbi:uncharacterized protein LOC114516515 [Dendronephthya gigantea]|uniref:uncharacterized protein LOC114516515 n=1 Tax=Dendronephthya gigantea TaxID=151771 RepID=UPI00106D98AB|nr:uncharacterized protein LOC114516515 [Dendronephthya gigantea]